MNTLQTGDLLKQGNNLIIVGAKNGANWERVQARIDTKNHLITEIQYSEINNKSIDLVNTGAIEYLGNVNDSLKVSLSANDILSLIVSFKDMEKYDMFDCFNEELTKQNLTDGFNSEAKPFYDFFKSVYFQL